MRQFQLIGPENLGLRSLSVIKKGIEDADEVVQEHAVYSLRRYAGAGISRINDPDIAQRLLVIVASHSSGRVAAEAANAYGFIYGVTNELKEAVIVRVDESEDPNVVSMLLGVLKETGITLRGNEESLLRILEGPPSDAALAAAQDLFNREVRIDNDAFWSESLAATIDRLETAQQQ